jgi:hypothetical protein
MDHAYRLVSDCEPLSHRVFPANDMHIGSADGGEPDLNHGLTGTGFGDDFFFQPKIARRAEYVRVHHPFGELLRFSLFECEDHLVTL